MRENFITTLLFYAMLQVTLEYGVFIYTPVPSFTILSLGFFP